MTTDRQPVWFITGASTGFGRELAFAVLRRGWRVVATARRLDSLAEIVSVDPGRVLALELDVTKAAQVEDGVAAALRRFDRIDVLVNNAGYGYLGAVEEGDEAEARAVMDVNFFAAARVIRAVLPTLRAQRSGLIINISSVGGFIGNPGSGYYAASKFALEGLSESLQREVGTLGIGVLVVEPSGFRTDWAGRSLRQAERFLPDYEETSGARRRTVAANSGSQPGDPQRAAEAIIVAATSSPRPFRLALGQRAVNEIRAKLRVVAADLETWQEVSIAADHPAGPA